MSSDEGRETGRVEAFSDGVFAIAITLLVLELKVPHLPDGGAGGSLVRALAAQWPSYVSLVTSFATILIMWANHHALFCMVQRIDARFLFANGFLLLVVTVVPFPTAVLAQYFTKPGASAAAAFYAGTYFVGAIAYNVLWASASRGRRLLYADVTETSVDRLTRRYRLGPPLYAAAALAAFVSATITVVVCGALCAFWIVAARDELAAERAAA